MQTSSASAASKVQANLQELFKGKLAPGDAYIKFQLTAKITALLSMQQVQESLIVDAENITSLPAMPSSVIGMMSRSDKVFCIFDLAQLLSLNSSLVNPRRYQILVLESKSEPLIQIGLAVSNLQGIIRILSHQLKSFSAISSGELTPYLTGVIEENEQEIPVLKFESIWETLTTLDRS